MSLHTQTEHVISSALALATAPLDVGEYVDPREREHYERQEMQRRVDDYTREADDVLARLRAFRRAAQSAADLLREEAARLERRAAQHDSTAAYCDERALAVLMAERAGAGGSAGERWKRTDATGYAAIRVTRSQSVAIDDVDALPAALVRVVPTPDKTAIKAALKAGPVPGAHIEERVTESLEWSR